MCLGINPATFGLHLYQRPAHSALFETPSIECACTPALRNMPNVSATTSSVFPLPDVSDTIFPCGLIALRVPWRSYLAPNEFERIGYSTKDLCSVLCAITATTKGDIYTHNILESRTPDFHGRAFDHLPLGYTALPVPEIEADHVTSWNELHIPVSNQFPTPSQALRPTLDRSLARGTVDLTYFIDCEDAELKRKQRRELLRKKREKAESVGKDESERSEATGACNGTRIDDLIGSSADLNRVPVRPIKMAECSAVVSHNSNDSGNITLPQHLLHHDHNKECRVEQFAQPQQSTAEKTLLQSDTCRSDLTASVFARAWDDDTESSDDETLPV
jgi:hypothetical protein